jgi:uncharacterized protein (DUF924 family)
MEGNVERHEALLAFWFGTGTPEHLRPRRAWFTTDPAFDAEIRSRFHDDLQRALLGELSAWTNTRESCLALVILCDQVPRNLFRNDAKAFSTDPLARGAARIALDRGDDQVLAPVQRWFLYLPFEHSENLDDQRRSVVLFEQLRDDPDSSLAIEFAYKHLAIIERFGRFPHRNLALGRTSTPEEEAFLRTPGSSF